MECRAQVLISLVAFVTFDSCCFHCFAGPQMRHVSSEGQFKMPRVSCCCDMYLNCRSEAGVDHLVKLWLLLKLTELMCLMMKRAFIWSLEEKVKI